MTRATLILSTVILALAGCWDDNSASDGDLGPNLRTVRTEIAQFAEPIVTRSYPAVLEPPQITSLAFDVGGRLGPVTLQIGQVVEAGQVLARVEAEDADLRLQQAEAALHEAQAALINAEEEEARQQQLFLRDVVSAAAVDRAVTAAEQARARAAQQARGLDLVQASLADTELRAPFDAIVNSVEVQNFGSVAVGQPVVTLYEDGGLQAAILVSYEVASTLTLGQTVQVLPGDGEQAPLRAVVSEIAQRAPAVSSFPVVIALQETRPDLRSGMAVEVLIDVSLPEDLHGVSLPTGALATQFPADLSTPSSREAHVMVYSPGARGQGTVHSRSVLLSAVIEDRIIIREGVADGERVVTAGVPFLDDGQAVRLEDDVDRVEFAGVSQ